MLRTSAVGGRMVMVQVETDTIRKRGGGDSRGKAGVNRRETRAEIVCTWSDRRIAGGDVGPDGTNDSATGAWNSNLYSPRCRANFGVCSIHNLVFISWRRLGRGFTRRPFVTEWWARCQLCQRRFWPTRWLGLARLRVAKERASRRCGVEYGHKSEMGVDALCRHWRRSCR